MLLTQAATTRQDDFNAIHVLKPSRGEDHSEAVRAIRRARDHRSRFFSPTLFSDPAWDMLLELYLAELEQRRLSTSAVSDAAGVAGTTGLRWLDVFTAQGLITKQSDPLDARRVWVRLSPRGLVGMHAYFASEVAIIDSLFKLG